MVEKAKGPQKMEGFVKEVNTLRRQLSTPPDFIEWGGGSYAK